MNPHPMQGGGAAAQPILDQEARRRIRESLEESLIVEASAGTGKTTELVNRIVAVLAAGHAEIGQIAAVTFTHKAAGELKLRLREKLDAARQQDGASRTRLEHALQHLEEAAIGTIHSFCAQLLRERPVEARVDPAFTELSEQEATRLLQASFRSWMERQLEQPSPGLRRAFARLAWRDSWDDSPPMEQLQHAARKLVEWRDYPAAWRREPFSREEEIRTLLRKAREVADASSRARRVTDNLYKALQPARLLVQGIQRSERADTEPDYDTLEAQLLKLQRDLAADTKKGSGDYGGGVRREELIAARDELLVWLHDFRRKADADLAAGLRDEMQGLLVEYQSRKEALGKLDFVDLLALARDLVRDHRSVRNYLQRRFRRLFIDEFQDTDPLQAEILLLLAADDPAESDWLQIRPEPGKLFVVGDPKQSIYKFRRADIEMYRQIRDDLVGRGCGLVALTKSFRSVLNIQQFVNAAFETEMSGNDHAEYAPLENHRPDQSGRPSIIALPVPRPYLSRIAKTAVNRSLPDAIAAFIHWLVQESGWTYARESDGEQVPFRARDIAVLFRRRTQGGADLTREYARALEARRVDHLLAGSRSFHHREEVETLRAALTAIEWPEDELSVFATLKGSLFAISDEMLLLHKHKHGRIHPFRSKEADPALAAALELIAELHRLRNHRPFAATVNALLEATRAHAGFLLRPGGNQVLANVARVADLARIYEMTGGVSFRGFVEELTTQAEKEEASEAPVLEEDSDGVRLMTVHGAKGLEFPCVILADITANISARDPDLYVDGVRRLCATRLLRCAPWELLEHENEEAARERAEGVRVAYVAATRARDLLVVPAVGDEAFPQEGWLSPLHKALYPSRETWRSSTEAEGCPKFGKVSVVERPPEYAQLEETSVRPGLIQPQTGPHQVVWWDPHQLHLQAEVDFGIRQEELLTDDGGVSLRAFEQWGEQRAATIQTAAVPRFEVIRPSDPVSVLPAGFPIEAVDVLTTGRLREGANAKGRRFGTLVHAVLRDIALQATEAEIRRETELQARLLAASPEEVEMAAVAVRDCLAHPLLDRARAAEASGKRCHREYPITVALEGTQLLEAVIDLAFLEVHSEEKHSEEECNKGQQWTVVDFKTDSDLTDPDGTQLERYRQQVQWYCYALTRLTGIAARGVLLQV